MVISNTDISGINYLLLIVLAIMVVFTISGYRRGFLRLAVSLISMVLCMWLIYALTHHISSFLRNNTDLYETVTVRINEAFAENNSLRDNTIFENHRETIESYNLPAVVKDMLIRNDTSQVYEALVANVFEEYVSKFLADLVIKAVSFLCAYFLVMILMKITLFSADFIGRLPVIKGLNRLAGGVAGFGEGLLIVLLLFTAGTFLMGDSFYDMVKSSRILSMIYDNNIILSIMGRS